MFAVIYSELSSLNYANEFDEYPKSKNIFILSLASRFVLNFKIDTAPIFRILAYSKFVEQMKLGGNKANFKGSYFQIPFVHFWRRGLR